MNDCLKIAEAYWCLGDFDKTLSYIRQTELYIDQVKVSSKSRYFAERLSVECELSSYDDVYQTIQRYISSIPSSKIHWLVVSNSYFFLNMHDKALAALTEYSSLKNDYHNNAGYHAMASKIYAATGQYDKALYHNNYYVHLSDSLDLIKFAEDTEFIQERYEKDLAILEGKQRNLIAFILIIVLCIMIVLSLVYIVKLSREKQVLNTLVKTAEKEKKALSEMLVSIPIKDPQIYDIISDRLELLNNIIINHRLSDLGGLKRTQEKIKMLTNDTKEYLSTICMSYMVKKSSFVSYLKSKGLSTWEIGYCCLYIMGYNAKEISGIMNNNQVYKISSEIRKKLGMVDGKNRLETILKNIYSLTTS